jgi:hypothetical protein
VDRFDRELRHLALPTAATIVHIETIGVPPDASKMAETRDVLNNVAHAISNVVAIYAQDPESGMPVEISAAELLDARFLRGAHLLVTKRGKEYRGLTVQRRDLNEAILILRRIGFAIKPAGARAS